MKNNIKNKIAVVTGGSQGIGFAIAEALSLKGAKVLIVSRNKKKLKLAKKKIASKNGIIEILAGDVSKKNVPVKVIKKAKKLWGNVDILINNAGGPPPGKLLEQSDSNWDKAINTNLLSTVRFSRAVIPSMRKKKWGRIISISSTIAKEPSPAMILSATSRAGVMSFSKVMAIEFSEYNITTNVISPGGVFTNRLINLIQKDAKKKNKNFKKHLKDIEKTIPAKRFAKPFEIANTVLFLCSDDASYINGQNLSIDGALTKGY